MLRHRRDRSLYTTSPSKAGAEQSQSPILTSVERYSTITADSSYSTFSSSFTLWNMISSEPLTSPNEEGSYIGQLNDLAFSPNGQQLVSVGFAGSVSAGGTSSEYELPAQGIVTLWNIARRHTEFCVMAQSRKAPRPGLN